MYRHIDGESKEKHVDWVGENARCCTDLRTRPQMRIERRPWLYHSDPAPPFWRLVGPTDGYTPLRERGDEIEYLAGPRRLVHVQEYPVPRHISQTPYTGSRYGSQLLGFRGQCTNSYLKEAQERDAGSSSGYAPPGLALPVALPMPTPTSSSSLGQSSFAKGKTRRGSPLHKARWLHFTPPQSRWPNSSPGVRRAGRWTRLLVPSFGIPLSSSWPPLVSWPGDRGAQLDYPRRLSDHPR